MFSHVVVGTNQVDTAKIFYDAVMRALGITESFSDETRVMYQQGAESFIVTKPIDGQAATAANGGTIGFSCSTTEVVDAWHAAGLRNGGTSCENPPGIREAFGARFYLAYMRDPSGNKLCAYCIP
ncbi:MAG TPA: VOC family protein [Pseudomonas sp.]|nr:VOC family protein [Pseudomonas sp.]